MTGPEHYREAERLVSEAVSWDRDEWQMRADGVVLAAAQVHATLALAAAQVEQAHNADGTYCVHPNWLAAIS